MGRQLFYMVAISYLTIYLAVIFLITANTVIGVQFLTLQQRAQRRYRTLIRLGAGYEVLCRSAKRQIRYFFGIPMCGCAVSSIFGVRALFAGLLFSRVQDNMSSLLLTAAAVILLLLSDRICLCRGGCQKQQSLSAVADGAGAGRIEKKHILRTIFSIQSDDAARGCLRAHRKKTADLRVCLIML